VFDDTTFSLDLCSSDVIINSMIINWDKQMIKSEINKISFAESDPRMDGFVTWGCKKDLYELLWYIEDALEKCSDYVTEEEHLKSRDKELMLKALGKK
jgi:hypothetical protein